MTNDEAGQSQVIAILSEDSLYRRIHPSFKKNGKVSTAIFKQRDPHLSVDVAKLTTPECCLAGYQNHGLAGILAGFVRQLSLNAYHEPLPDNYAHGIVEGKITDGIAKKLALSADLIVEPESV